MPLPKRATAHASPRASFSIFGVPTNGHDSCLEASASLKFLPANDLRMASLGSKHLRKLALSVSQWWRADLSQGAAEAPLRAVDFLCPAGISFPSFAFAGALRGVTTAQMRAAALPGCTCGGGACGPDCGCYRRNPPSTLAGGPGRAYLFFECHAGCACAGFPTCTPGRGCRHRPSAVRAGLPLYAARRDAAKGWGLECAEALATGDPVCAYTGEVAAAGQPY